MAGQILGEHYEIERELGRQSGRWTLLARDLNNQEQVVIKLLSPEEDLRSSDLKLFEREAEALKSLFHPCVPQYLDYFEHQLPTGKVLALVQTYVLGKSLDECMKIGRTFTEEEAKQIAKSLLYILIYLHGRPQPTVHRDIAPSNIVLAQRRTHLVNFGSVKMLLNSDRSTFTLIATHDYMPPEQFAGRALTVSDLYSLGATLIAIITGKSPSQLPRKGTRINFQEVVDLSPAFADWLSWMTETSLDRRLQSAKQSLQVLESGQIREA